jgi:hypothetical protein
MSSRLERKKERNRERAYRKENVFIKGAMYVYAGDIIGSHFFIDEDQQKYRFSIKTGELLMFIDSTMILEGGRWVLVIKCICDGLIGYIRLPCTSGIKPDFHYFLIRFRSKSQ